MVGLAVDMYVIPAEAIRVCPGILMEKLGERHSLRGILFLDIDADVETWSFWEPSSHEGRGCFSMKAPQRAESSEQRNGDKVIPEDMFEHLDPAMAEAFKPQNFSSL